MSKTNIIVGLGICLIGLAGLLLWTPSRAVLLAKGISQETQGLAVATDLGCFHCHGPAAQGGIANPGAGKIPSLTDFAFTMSVHSEADLHAWILDGAPAAEREKPDYQAGLSKRAVAMPAYRDRLSDEAFAQLLAWYHAVAGTVYPQDPDAKAGYETARDSGCFSCHGTGGRFDLPNPGSLTGWIPAWHGPNFAELARDEAEIRAWILDGAPERLRKHPIANHFLQNQLIQMPAYRGKLNDDQVAAILAYIRWLRDPSAPGHTPSYQSPEEPAYDPYDYH